MHAGQPRRAAREPDAGQIVAGEHAMLVDGARGDDHRLRVRQVEQVGRVDHHERALVDADRRRLLQHRDRLRGGGVREQLVDALAIGAGGDLLAGPALVAEQHRPPGLGRRECRGQACHTGADHDEIGMRVAGLAVRGRLQLRDRAAACHTPHHRLGAGPGPARAQQRLVVEADRQEPVHAVEHSERVAIGGRPAGLPVHPLPRRRSCDTRAHAGVAVDVQHAVRAVACEAVQSAAAVVLERPREHADAARDTARKRRCRPVRPESHVPRNRARRSR